MYFRRHTAGYLNEWDLWTGSWRGGEGISQKGCVLAGDYSTSLYRIPGNFGGH